MTNSQNMFFEGDNLESLKMIQEIYLGRAKLGMIQGYPASNTGRGLCLE